MASILLSHRQDRFYKYNCWLVWNNPIFSLRPKMSRSSHQHLFWQKKHWRLILTPLVSHKLSATKFQQFGVDHGHWRDSGHACAKSIHIHLMLFIGAVFVYVFVVVWISNSRQTLKHVWYQAIILWYTVYTHTTILNDYNIFMLLRMDLCC